MSITYEQFARLPKWAQAHIERLERDVQSLKEAQAVANGARGSGRVTLNPYKLLQEVTLPDTSRVRFNLGEREWIDVDERDPGAIHVMGSTQLVIFPHVTNVLSIKLAGR